MKKSRACFADGGQISKADQLIAEMNAKYGVSGNSPAPAPVAQQPAPQPQQAPKPQSKGLVGDAMNLFGNRQKQIDKASGYANGGLIEGIGTPTSDSIPAKVQETGEDIAVSTKERIVSHEQDKLLQRLAKAMGFDSVDAFFEAGTGKPVGPTIKGGKRAAENGADLKKPWYMQDPLTALSSSIEKSMNASQSAEDYNKSLYPAGTFDSATKPTPQQSATGNPLSSVSPTYQQSRPGASDVGLAGIGNKPSTASTSDNQFTQGGKSYNVNDTSQQGILRVTAPGTSPLYTNIDPQKAVAGLKDQTIGQPADQEAQGIARIANANKIRGEMIANRDKDIPAGGYAPGILGDGGVEAANAEKTQRWRQDDLLRLATRGNQAAIGALLNSDGHRDVAAMNNETSRQNAGVAAQRESNRDQVTMRGQDLNAQNELLRLQGNPLDNQTKQLSLTQAQQIGKLQDAVLNGKTPEEQAAAAAKIRALYGKQDREDRTVKPMEIADPNDPMGQRKILVRPNDDGTYTPMQPRRTYAEFAQAYLSKKPGTSPEQMKADYEQLYGSR